MRETPSPYMNSICTAAINTSTPVHKRYTRKLTKTAAVTVCMNIIYKRHRIIITIIFIIISIIIIISTRKRRGNKIPLYIPLSFFFLF